MSLNDKEHKKATIAQLVSAREAGSGTSDRFFTKLKSAGD
jgi:hypothetical protein